MSVKLAALLKRASQEKQTAIKKAVSAEGGRKTLRALIRSKTGNGEELVCILLDLARGKPVVYKMDDGRETNPIFPSPDTMRQAAKDLTEMGFGKAVPQTEILKAELESQNLEQMEAMTDEQLKELAGWHGAEQKRLNLTVDSDPASDDE